MTGYCTFSKDHKCIQWNDYENTRHELEEANELCHATGLRLNISGSIYSKKFSGKTELIFHQNTK